MLVRKVAAASVELLVMRTVVRDVPKASASWRSAGSFSPCA